MGRVSISAAPFANGVGAEGKSCIITDVPLFADNGFPSEFFTFGESLATHSYFTSTAFM